MLSAAITQHTYALDVNIICKLAVTRRKHPYICSIYTHKKEKRFADSISKSRKIITPWPVSTTVSANLNHKIIDIILGLGKFFLSILCHSIVRVVVGIAWRNKKLHENNRSLKWVLSHKRFKREKETFVSFRQPLCMRYSVRQYMVHFCDFCSRKVKWMIVWGTKNCFEWQKQQAIHLLNTSNFDVEVYNLCTTAPFDIPHMCARLCDDFYVFFLSDMGFGRVFFLLLSPTASSQSAQGTIKKTRQTSFLGIFLALAIVCTWEQKTLKPLRINDKLAFFFKCLCLFIFHHWNWNVMKYFSKNLLHISN